MAYEPRYEPGRYLGTVTQQFVRESSNGNPYLQLKFSVDGKVNPADPEGDLLHAPQNECTLFLYCSEKTSERFAEEVALLGFPDGWCFDTLDQDNPHCFSIRGNQHAFVCAHEPRQEKQGDKYVEVAGVQERWRLANSKPQSPPLEDNRMQQLNAMFGRSLPKRAIAPKQATAEQIAKDLSEAKEPDGGSEMPPKRTTKLPENTPAAEQGGPDDNIPF